MSTKPTTREVINNRIPSEPMGMLDHAHTQGIFADHPRDLDRRGYDAMGGLVWVSGPESTGPREGKRWAVRTMTRRNLQDPTRRYRSKAWDGGWCGYNTRAAALAAFRRKVGLTNS